MRWINLHQQYVGMWQNGVQVIQNSPVHVLSRHPVRLLSGRLKWISIHFKVFALILRISLFWQHGRGTHFWNTSQGEGGHFFLSSQYTGDFVQGQRHGHGKICFASGATYVGEWRHDKSQEKVQQLQSGLVQAFMPSTNVGVRVTQGKFTRADGRVLEGDHLYDQIMTQCLNSNRDLQPLSGKALQQLEHGRPSPPGTVLDLCPLSVSTPDLTLNIGPLLAMIPASQRDAEYEQVRLCLRISDLVLTLRLKLTRELLSNRWCLRCWSMALSWGLSIDSTADLAGLSPPTACFSWHACSCGACSKTVTCIITWLWSRLTS